MDAVIGLCFFASIACLLWAIVRSIVKRRSRWHYGSAAVLFALAVVLAPFAPSPRPAVSSAKTKSVPNPTPSPAPVKRPLPTQRPIVEPTDSADMQKFRTTWMDIAERAGSAVADAQAASGALKQGDAVTASQKLKDCEDTASDIKLDGYALPLSTSDDDMSLIKAVSNIGDDLGYGCKSMRAYLDTRAPADAADGKTRLASAPIVMGEAQYLADAKYKSMGGYGAILDFKSAIEEAK